MITRNTLWVKRSDLLILRTIAVFNRRLSHTIQLIVTTNFMVKFKITPICQTITTINQTIIQNDKPKLPTIKELGMPSECFFGPLSSSVCYFIARAQKVAWTIIEAISTMMVGNHLQLISSA